MAFSEDFADTYRPWALVLFSGCFEGYEFIVGAILAVLGFIVGWSAWGSGSAATLVLGEVETRIV